MKANRPIGSLSLDLDNEWSYRKTAGIPGWEDFPSYLDTAVPRFLGVMEELDLKLTVFIVGQDAALEKNHPALRQITAAGHEVGNHSFHHEPWLVNRSEDEIRDEIIAAEQAILAATGQRPGGWRGPSFVRSPAIFRVLCERGYRYDASTFPTFLGPLARAYYFLKSGLRRGDRDDRKQLFGSLRDGFRPLNPYWWELEADRRLLEIPVTTMPLFRTPIHLSYLLYLATFSPGAARLYFAAALALCRLLRVRPSLLLHPLDFLGGDDVPALAFFPAMNRPGDWKTARTREFVRMYRDRFRVGPMEAHADSVTRAEERPLPRFVPEPLANG